MLHINKSVSRIKNSITLFLCLVLGGCIWWPTGTSSDDYYPHSSTYDMWFEEVDIYCEYDAPEQWSYWTLIAVVDTTAGSREIDDVYVDIGGSYAYTYNNSFRLTPDQYGTWSYTFQNYGWEGNSYYCGSSYDFQFTAYDYYGNYITTWYYW